MTSPVNGSAAARSARARLSRQISMLVPAIVTLGTAAIITYTAWPLLRPAPEVRVAQAVFDRSVQTVAEADASQDKQRDVPTVQAAGWLEPEPYYTACTALTDGVVEEVTVLEGEFVEQGAVVARLVAEDAEMRLRNAQAMLSDMRARLKRETAEREAAERNWQDPIELRRKVASGEAGLAEARAELERLPALIDKAQATLHELQEEYERIARLRDSGSSTQTEVIVAEQRVKAQRAELNATEALEPVWDARVDRLASDLRAAKRDLELRIRDREQLDTARAAEEAARAAVQQAEVRRDEAQLELDRMTIRAPISGYVMRRLKGPGDKVMLGTEGEHSAHVLHLYDPEKLQVRVDVPLADASHVYDGQACEVVVEVLPGRVFRGEVIRSIHRADLQKNTLQFKVRVLDPAPILRPEMLTRVKFLPPDRRAGSGSSEQRADRSRVLVPEAALDRSTDKTRVWLITDRRAGRGKLQPVSVEAGTAEEGWVRITGSVQPGALIALDFADARSGRPVVIRPNRKGSDA